MLETILCFQAFSDTKVFLMQTQTGNKIHASKVFYEVIEILFVMNPLKASLAAELRYFRLFGPTLCGFLSGLILMHEDLEGEQWIWLPLPLCLNLLTTFCLLQGSMVLYLIPHVVD